VGTLLSLVGGLPAAQSAANPVRAAPRGSPLWRLAFPGVAALGAVAQYQTARGWEVELFNRLTRTGCSGAGAAPGARPAP
jgi:hypothetical protein